MPAICKLLALGRRWSFWTFPCLSRPGEYVQSDAGEDAAELGNVREEIEMYEALAYRIEPEGEREGIYSLDGEVVLSSTVQGIVMPGLARILRIEK